MHNEPEVLILKLIVLNLIIPLFLETEIYFLIFKSTYIYVKHVLYNHSVSSEDAYFKRVYELLQNDTFSRKFTIKLSFDN